MFKPVLRFSLIAALLMSAPLTYARQLSLKEALKNAPEGFSAVLSRSGDSSVYTETVESLNVAYIIASDRDNKGYVVLAADDVLPPMLGYADSGSFDPANIPPAMSAWLKSYGSQLSYAMNHQVRRVDLSRSTDDRTSIAPLCMSKWGQDSPYNSKSPEINGVKAPTGCISTAMAQVAYYHKWPVTGTGVNTYKSSADLELTFDFGATTFSWDRMADEYNVPLTPVRINAVATLMQACGNASRTTYGEYSSGASPYDAIYGLVKFLNYDKSTVMLERDYFTYEQWNDIVYNELKNNRPVLYGGSNNDGGHAFVIDGYSQDGYFHVNWGWDGLSDGYFLLTALDPDAQGTGGTSSGYNFYQNASVNLMPAKEDSEYQIVVYQYGDIKTNATIYNSDESITVTATGYDRFNAFTLIDREVTMGLEFTPVDGGDPVFCSGPKVTFKSYYGESYRSGVKSYTVNVSSLPKSGTYTVTSAYMTSDGRVSRTVPQVGCVSSLKATCMETGVIIEPIAVERTLRASDIKVSAPVYSGKNCTVSASVSNIGEEYLNIISPVLLNSSKTIVTWLNGTNVNVRDGETVEISITAPLVNSSTDKAIEAGDYYINLYDVNGNPLSVDPCPVTVLPLPAGKPVFISKITPVGEVTGSGTYNDPYLVGDQFSCNLDVTVTSGLFDDTVALYAYYADNNSDADLGSQSVYYNAFFVGGGYSESKTYVLDTSTLEADRVAYLSCYGWNSNFTDESTGWFGTDIYLKRVASGISDIKAVASGSICPNPAVATTTVTALSGIRSIEIYNLMGVKVISLLSQGDSSVADIDVSALPSGHYVVVVNTADGIERHRLMKR